MNKLLKSAGMAVVATFVAGSAFAGELAGADAWAAKVCECLARHDVLAKDASSPGCYITTDYRIWCPSNVDASIPNGCSVEANKALMPARLARKG